MRKLFFALLLFLAAQFQSQTLTTSLSACYNLNGQAHDPINNLHGYMYQLNSFGPVIAGNDRFGTANSCLRFTGSTSFVSLPDTSLLKPAANITIAGWVQMSFLSPLIRLVFTKNSSGTTTNMEAYQLAVVQTTAGFRFQTSKATPTSSCAVTGTSAVSNNTWYFIACTMNNSSMKLYVNGVLEGTITPTFPGFDYMPGKRVILGQANESGNNGPLTGEMDNFKFYNRVLSATEINQLYTTDPPCYTSPPPPPDCNNNIYYTITLHAIYAFRATDPVPSPTVIPIVVPGGAQGLAVGPAFGFSAPNPTYWTLVGGNFWYFDGTDFVNSNHSAGAGVTNLGGSKNFIYSYNNTNSQIFNYTGTGNANYLATIATFSSGSAYDIIGDELDNFYMLGTNAWLNLHAYKPNGTLLYNWPLTGFPSGVISGGFAINQNTITAQRQQTFYTGKINTSVVSFSPAAFSQSLTNDFANCPIAFSAGITCSQINDTISCKNPIIKLIANTTNFLPSYAWSGPGIISTSSNTITINLPGVYSCTVTNGITTSTSVTNYTVPYSNVPLAINIIPPDTVACSKNISIPLSASGAIFYNWSPGTSLSSTVNPNVIANPSVTTTYTLTGTTTGTCIGTAIRTISVNPTPTLNLTFSDSLLCPNETTTLSLSGAPTFTISEGVNSFTNSPVVLTPTSTTTFSVIGISVDGCADTAYATVQTVLSPSISVSQLDSVICAGQTTTITVLGALTYVINDSLNSFTTNPLAITPTITTTYTIIGTDVNGCSDTTTVTQNVNSCIGINELNTGLGGINIYPNPNNGDFILETNLVSQQMHAEIYSSTGHLLFSKKLNDQKTRVDLRGYSNGVYLIRIILPDGTPLNYKLIKN